MAVPNDSREFRRLNKSDTWHFCTDCPSWPKDPGTYVSHRGKPTSGEFDNTCQARYDRKECRANY